MSCSDPVVFATFAGGSAKTKTTLGSSQESEAPRSSHPPPSHILVDSSFSRLYWVCLKVGYPFEESPGLSASFPFEEYPSFLYFTQPQIVGIPKKIIKNHNVQQYPLDYIHLSFISIIIRNWDPRDPLTIEKKTGWSYLGIHPPGHFWSGPSGCTTAVPVFRSRSVCADCLRSHGKKHPSVYGLYHPKKVGRLVTSGIVYSCFNNSECGKSLIMVDVFWDSQVISSTTASIKGLPLYGASSHQLESEASLDLPATRQQTLTPQKA